MAYSQLYTCLKFYKRSVIFKFSVLKKFLFIMNKLRYVTSLGLSCGHSSGSLIPEPGLKPYQRGKSINTILKMEAVIGNWNPCKMESGLGSAIEL